jgi:hypothetical protein
MTKLNKNKLQEYHQEVVQALKSIGNPSFGKAVRQDRGSNLEYLGIKFPVLRKRVKQGFSFTRRTNLGSVGLFMGYITIW